MFAPQRCGELECLKADHAPRRLAWASSAMGLQSPHVDVKYLPQMQDEAARRYVLVAIDRATRWGLVAS